MSSVRESIVVQKGGLQKSGCFFGFFVWRGGVLGVNRWMNSKVFLAILLKTIFF